MLPCLPVDQVINIVYAYIVITACTCAVNIILFFHVSQSLFQVSFLSALVSFYAQIYLEKSKELHLLLEICLQKYLFVQRQQANQRKVIIVTNN